MEKVMSTKDVIVCRGIWYVMTLLSIFGLYISLNLVWPPGGKSSSSSSRFLRDGAVTATTFYAVTLLRYLFFSDTPSPCYKVLTTPEEVFLQICVLNFSLNVVMTPQLLIYKLLMENVYVLPLSLFTISLFTGGIWLIQLSDKLRM
ncbi:unnamed protein product [Thlaspi arvense]|uniref:Uncharacterized protein n=1 Tax=Thlaspi arvense TaxID=13288 RepID=A0AAU9RUV8_THLAR|nr:unnamed protein product [Thlaspi arvense]